MKKKMNVCIHTHTHTQTNKAENNFKIGMDTFNYEYVAKIFDGFDFDCNHITHTRRYKYSSAGLEADKMK